MRQIFFIWTVFLTLTTFLIHGQTDTAGKDKNHYTEFDTINTFRPNGLFINFTQLGIGEIDVEYERFIFKNRRRLSISNAWGYKYFRGGFDESIGPIANTGYGEIIGFLWSKSIYASFSTKIYKKDHAENKSPYIEWSLFFRHNFYDKVLVHYGKQHDNGINVNDRLQSATMNVYGIKFIIGTKKRYSNIGHIVFTRHLFIGVGLRAKRINLTTFEESPNPAFPLPGSTYVYNPPKQENYWRPITPSLQGGLKLGWEWKRK